MHLYLPDTHERDVCLALICKGGMLNYEKKEKHQLCKMGIHLYPSIFYNFFNLFFDSAGRYCTL